MKWETVRLGDLYEIHNGLSKGGKFFGSGYPFLSFSTVFNHFFIPDELSDYVQSTEAERKNYSIRRGDIFITRTSETSDELGMSCVALKDYPDATYNGFTKRMRPITNRVLPEYIGYYMRTPVFRAKISVFSSIITRASLKNGDLLRLTVELPNLQTQNKIASILSSYDNLIENNQKRIKLLEQMAQRLYQEWFVRFRFPGYETTKFVDGIPQGWEKCKLKDMIAFNPVYRIKKGSVYTKIPMEALPTDGLSIDTDSIMAEDSSSGTHFMNGDVLCAKITPCLENGKTGLVTCLQEDEVGVGSTEFIVMHGERVDSFFIYCIARDERFRQQAINSMNGADGRQRADISFIQNRPWILPDKQILRQFKALTDKMVATVLRLEQQNKNLAKQRDLLLPRLMSGKLAV